MPHPAHFVDLRRAIPGKRMLSDRLTELAAAGLVLREVNEGPPLRVTYRLTDAGAALDPALQELAAWAKVHLPRSWPCAGAGRGGAGVGRRAVWLGVCGAVRRGAARRGAVLGWGRGEAVG
jgi:hypothetical protein